MLGLEILSSFFLGGVTKAGVRGAGQIAEELGTAATEAQRGLRTLGEVGAVGGRPPRFAISQQRMLSEARQNPFIPSNTVDQSHLLRESDEALVRLETGRAGGGGRIPPRARGIPLGADEPPPSQSWVGLEDDLEIPLHDGMTETALAGTKRGRNQLATQIFRKWNAGRDVEGLASEEAWFQSRQLLRRLKIKPSQMTEQTMKPLWQSLDRTAAQIAAGEHDPNSLPIHLKMIYDDLRHPGRWVNKEEVDSLEFFRALTDQKARTLVAFDTENVVQKFMAHPEYFHRSWRRKGSPNPLGSGLATPNYMMPRVGATFDEMVDAGFEPVTWDPYAMATIRRQQGVNYRENVRLVNRLFSRGLAKTRNEVDGVDGFEGWRKPDIRSAVFDGRPIPGDNVISGQTLTTPQIWVPDKVATFLENVYKPNAARLQFGDTDILPFIRTSRQALKKVKLSASLFQHIDFAARGTFVAFTPTGILHGGPIRLPSLYARLIAASVTERGGLGLGRAAVRQRLLSNQPFFKDFAITPRMVVEEGLQVGGDITIIEKQFADTMEQLARQSGATGNALAVLRKTSEFFEKGLFGGIYRVSMEDSLPKFVIPAIRRAHPNWTPRQVAAEAATQTNKIFSSLGTYQSVLQDRAFREFALTFAFSANEIQAPIQQALGAVVGKNKRFWTEWWAGVMTGLVAIANVIEFSATGKPLPAESYNPIKYPDPYSPFKVGYNTRFMSPQVPFLKGRNDTPIYLDVVGQMDTALRFAVNPVQAAASRLNVLPRAITNQVKGSGFFGEEFGPITTVQGASRRASQAAQDLFAPILATNVLGAARERVPALEAVTTETEPRLGSEALVAQGAGFNLRGQTTGQLLDAGAQGKYGANYRDIEPYQKAIVSEENRTELDARKITSARRAEGELSSARYFAEVDKIEQERIATQAGIVRLLADDELTLFGAMGAHFTNERRTRDKIAQTAALTGQEFERPTAQTVNEIALQDYYALGDRATVDGTFVLPRYLTLREGFEGSIRVEQLEYIRRNTNIKPLVPGMETITPEGTIERRKLSDQARERHVSAGNLVREGTVVPVQPAATPRPSPTPRLLERATRTPRPTEGPTPFPTPGFGRVPRATIAPSQQIDLFRQEYRNRVVKDQFVPRVQELVRTDPEVAEAVNRVTGGQELTRALFDGPMGEAIYVSIYESFRLGDLPDLLVGFYPEEVVAISNRQEREAEAVR